MIETQESKRLNEVCSRFLPTWLIPFGCFGFAYGLVDPFLLVDFPDYVRRPVSALFGLGIGLLVGIAGRWIFGLWTP